jgi:superfamily II DNA or RNA helicase
VNTKRPSFRKTKTTQAYNSPEELFGKLSNRVKTHGYLRAPQGDALREYVNYKTHPDIAFELPTGTGKTVVGLLIAEWRRRSSGGRVAYLTLTNQLAMQVLNEAEKLGFDCADLTGTKKTRHVAEVGRYQAGKAVV